MTEKVCRAKTNVLPLCHAANRVRGTGTHQFGSFYWHISPVSRVVVNTRHSSSHSDRQTQSLLYTKSVSSVRYTLRCVRLTDTDLCPCGETQCPTLSNPVPWQNWMACLDCTLQMKTLFRGWPVMVHDTHTRRRRRRSSVWQFILFTDEISDFCLIL